MKLSEEAPTQHLAIVVVALLFIFLNSLDAFKASQRNAVENGPLQNFTEHLDEMTGEVRAQKTIWQNPKLGFVERFLCRGNQRSSFCSYKMLVPNEEEYADLNIPDRAPKKDHVVNYHGSMGKNTVFSSRLEAPQTEVDPSVVAEKIIHNNEL